MRDALYGEMRRRQEILQGGRQPARRHRATRPARRRGPDLAPLPHLLRHRRRVLRAADGQAGLRRAVRRDRPASAAPSACTCCWPPSGWRGQDPRARSRTCPTGSACAPSPRRRAATRSASPTPTTCRPSPGRLPQGRHDGLRAVQGRTGLRRRTPRRTDAPRRRRAGRALPRASTASARWLAQQAAAIGQPSGTARRRDGPGRTRPRASTSWCDRIGTAGCHPDPAGLARAAAADARRSDRVQRPGETASGRHRRGACSASSTTRRDQRQYPLEWDFTGGGAQPARRRRARRPARRTLLRTLICSLSLRYAPGRRRVLLHRLRRRRSRPLCRPAARRRRGDPGRPRTHQPDRRRGRRASTPARTCSASTASTPRRHCARRARGGRGADDGPGHLPRRRRLGQLPRGLRHLEYRVGEIAARGHQLRRARACSP